MSAVRLEIHCKPRAKSNRIGINAAGGIDIAVTAPPVDDRANDHVVAFLSDVLELPKSSITVTRGRHGRKKIVAVQGLPLDEALRRIKIWKGAL